MITAKSNLHSKVNVMTVFCVVALVWLAAAVNSEGMFLYDGDKKASGIIEVTKNSGFFMTSTKNRIVEFYSPYCGHCQKFAKTYIARQEEVANKGYDIEFYAVSCAGVVDVCRKFSINAYPSLYAIQEGQEASEMVNMGRGVSFSMEKIESSFTLTTEKDGAGAENKGDKDKPDKGQDYPREDRKKTKSESAKNVHGAVDEQQALDSTLKKKSIADVHAKYFKSPPKKTVEDVHEKDFKRTRKTPAAYEKYFKKSDDGEADVSDKKDGVVSTTTEHFPTDAPTSADDRTVEDDEELEALAQELLRDHFATSEDEDEYTEDGGSEMADDQEMLLSNDDNEGSMNEFEAFKKGAGTKSDLKRAGANVAKDKAREMDKWKDIQKQRIREREYKWLRQKKAKAGSLGEDLVKNPEMATKKMKANRAGTAEFNERQLDFLKVLERMKRSKETKNKLREKLKKGLRPFQKKLGKQRLIEKIPVIKRVIRVDAEEELILDASLSFLEGLRIGVYKSEDALPNKAKRALKDWLDLLSVSLPPEWGLHEVIGDLIENFETVAQGPDQLNKIINRHPFPRKQWSKSCGSGSGFTCGFWRLLHIMTVGVAELRGGSDLISSGSYREDSKIFSPLGAADVLRAYMANFFPCSECAGHFVATYDQCESNRRCDRLTGDASSATDADWKELAKWLWEFHNDVSVRLLNERYDEERKEKQQRLVLKEKAGPGVAPLSDQVKVVWPSFTDCLLCFNDDGSFDEDAVFIQLERIYWPGHDLKDTPRRLIWLEDDGEGAFGLNLIFLFFSSIVVYFVHSRTSKVSVAQTVVRARALGTTVSNGGKVCKD